MKKLLLLILIPCLLLLNGCKSKLDQHYIDKLEPIYCEWLYQPFTHESDNWLDKNTRRIEADMRRDGYNGLQIKKIRDEAQDNAMKSIQWRQANGIDQIPLKPRPIRQY